MLHWDCGRFDDESGSIGVEVVISALASEEEVFSAMEIEDARGVVGEVESCGGRHRLKKCNSCGGRDCASAMCCCVDAMAGCLYVCVETESCQ